jgi:hypothetical protein
MTYDIIIYTNVADFPCQRAIGAYQLAGHLRSHGISVQIIDFTDYFTCEELEMSVSNSLLNLGYDRKYIRNTPLKNLPLEEIKNKAIAKVQLYKNNLKNGS